MILIKMKINKKMKIIISSTSIFGQVKISKEFASYNIKGSTTIYDLKNDRYYYSDSLDANKRTLPASTFKIINSCIALEEGAIKDENEVFKWDGEIKYFNGKVIDTWNTDTNLKNAFKNSTIWFYEELAKKIGKNRYKDYLKKCKYGNLDLSEKGVDFWNYGNLGISPKNQIELLKSLYKEELPFSKSTYTILKKIMISHEMDNYIIRSKTGWANTSKQSIGWWIGYVEKKNNTYFFATRLIKGVKEHNPKFSSLRKEITKSMLKHIKAIE